MVLEKEKPEETPEVKPDEEEPGAAIDPGLVRMISQVAGQIESRLADRLDTTIKSINTNLEATAAAVNEVRGQTKTALATAPALIKENVESMLEKNLKGIVEGVSKQFEGKIKAMAESAGLDTGGNGAGGGGGGGGLSLNNLLGHTDQIISVINAFRQPTTEQATIAHMSNVMKWHKILSSLEKGGGSTDELTNQIAKTFTPPEEE